MSHLRITGMIALSTFAAACNARPDVGEPTPAASAAPARTAHGIAPLAPAAGLSEVTDASQVCMVNNQYMGRPQIPVTVNGRTYYGCCAMCKGRLEKDASARTGTDPVTQRPIDKALAVIGKTTSGDVLYFESRATFAAYRND